MHFSVAHYSQAKKILLISQWPSVGRSASNSDGINDSSGGVLREEGSAGQLRRRDGDSDWNLGANAAGAEIAATIIQFSDPMAVHSP